MNETLSKNYKTRVAHFIKQVTTTIKWVTYIIDDRATD